MGQEDNGGSVYSMPKMCVFATYFGSLPNWFGLWAASCGANPDVDFFVVTDQHVEKLPSNVRILPETLAGIKAKIEVAVNSKIALERPYKMCDYRPFMGLAYSYLLKDYDYWGHCDLDLFFGDLKSCFEKYNLTNYDKFLPLGHFFLYRNTDEVNMRWQLPLDGKDFWRDVVSSDKNYYFDEQGINLIFDEHGFLRYDGHPFADIATIYHRVRLSPKFKDYKREVFYWKDGKAGRLAVGRGGSVVDEEFLYVHFQKRSYAAELVKAEAGEGFYFGSEGFMPMRGQSPNDAIDEVNPYDPVRELREGVRWCYRDLRRKISAIKWDLLNG